MPQGSYRFRADKNGTQFYGSAANNCTLPSCASTAVTVTIPVVVTVKDSNNVTQVGLAVYAFNRTTYTGYSKTTDANGLATFTLPQGNYRFRADKNGSQYFSNTTNHCTIPGCTTASITIPAAGGFKSGGGKLFSLINSSNNDFTNYPQLQSGVITTTITYTYDDLYRLTDAMYSDGNEFHYVYDAVGNILTKTVKLRSS